MNILTTIAALVAANPILVMVVLAISFLTFIFLWALVAASRQGRKSEANDLTDMDEDILFAAVQVTHWMM